MAKTSGTGGGKKAAKPAGRGKAAPRAKSAQKKAAAKPAAGAKPAASRSWSPAAVLVILALLIVIVYMVNQLYFTKDRDGKRPDASPKDRKEARVTPDDDDEKQGRDEKDRDKKDREAAKKSAKETQEHDVKIYVVRFNERTEKTELASVPRRVKGDEPLEAALQELLKGPSGPEKRGGLLSAMPERLSLRGVTVKNRTAYIDFNDAFEENAIGNIIQSRIDQIVYTATQFDEVDGVIIQVNGVAKKFVGGDGVVLNNPLTRGHR